MLSVLSSKRRREREAAAWFARLNGTVVAHGDLERFRRWRRQPGADEAFARIEATWRRLSPLEHDPEFVASISPHGRASPKPVHHPQGGVSTGALAASFVATAAVGAILVWSGLAASGQAYTTPVGGSATQVLSDGSKLVIDADTRIHVNIGPHERRIRLDHGRLLAEVAHDGTRPFVVVAGDTKVQALGTRFTVWRDTHRSEVVLLRGSVEVHRVGSDHTLLRLAPGQALTADRSSPVAVDADAALAWTHGRIVLNNLAPAEAVAEINRYTHHRLRLSPELNATPPVSGVFTSGDPDAFVAALTRLRGWRADPQPDGGVVLAPGP